MSRHETSPAEQRPALARVPWSLLDCGGVALATAAAVVVLVNLLGLLDAVVGLPGTTDLVLLPLPLATLAAVTIAWVHVRHRAVGELTGPVRAGAREWLVGLGLGVAGFLAVNLLLGAILQAGAGLVGVDLPEPQPAIREAAADPERLPWVILSAVVVAPVAEELFFRGMLHQALRRRTGRWASIAVSSVLFAAAHVIAEPTWAGGALVFVLTLPLGVLLAWLLERRATLAVPIAVHAAFNAITLGLMLLSSGDGVTAGG